MVWQLYLSFPGRQSSVCSNYFNWRGNALTLIRPFNSFENFKWVNGGLLLTMGRMFQKTICWTNPNVDVNYFYHISLTWKIIYQRWRDRTGFHSIVVTIFILLFSIWDWRRYLPFDLWTQKNHTKPRSMLMINQKFQAFFSDVFQEMLFWPIHRT